MEDKERMRNEVCDRLFKEVVVATEGDGAEIVIILKRTLRTAIEVLAKTDGLTPEMVNQTCEVIAHEFLSEALKTFAIGKEIRIINN